MSVEKSRFAWQSVTLFALGAAGVVLLNILKRHDLIHAETEGLVRLILNATWGSLLIYSSIRVPLDGMLRLCIYFAVFAALTETVLDYTEDVQAWNDVAFIGRNSSVRRTLESLLGAAWMAGGFGAVFVSIRLIRQSQKTAENTIEKLQQSEQNLTMSNQKLADALDELKEAQQQIIQQERLSAIGEMASGIAHDLNNALTPAVAFSKMLSNDSSNFSKEQAEFIDCINRSTRDAASTVKGLQRFYVRDTRATTQSLVSIGDLLEQVVSMTRPKWKDELEHRGHQIHCNLELDQCRPVNVIDSELRIVCTNLIFNAVEAMPNGGTLTIRCFENEQGEVVASVADTGTGMSEEAMSRCFEPFYTTRSRGSGLGLSVCHGIIAKSGGRIVVHSELGKGTTMSVILPADRKPLLKAINRPASSPSFERRVLLVDDDANVRKALATALRRLGADVTVATSGAAAIERLRNAHVDILMTDLGMPDMDGRQVVQFARNQFPHLFVAVISGWSKLDVSQQFSPRHSPDIVLQKPPSMAELHDVLEQFEDSMTAVATDELPQASPDSSVPAAPAAMNETVSSTPADN